MAEELLNHFKGSISEFTLIPSSGGVFEVMVDGKLIFSKKQLDRFPEYEEISRIVKDLQLLTPSSV